MYGVYVWIVNQSSISTANKEQEKWVFPIGDEQQKQKTKTKKQLLSLRNSSLFAPKPIDKEGESEIRTWILEC